MSTSHGHHRRSKPSRFLDSVKRRFGPQMDTVSGQLQVLSVESVNQLVFETLKIEGSGLSEATSATQETTTNPLQPPPSSSCPKGRSSPRPDITQHRSQEAVNTTQTPLVEDQGCRAEYYKRIIANTLKLGLDIVGSLTEIVPIPGLKAGMDILNMIVMRTDQACQNRIRVGDLIKYTESMSEILTACSDGESPLGNKMSEKLRSEVVDIERSLRNTTREAYKVQESGKLLDWINVSDNTQRLVSEFQNLKRMFQKLEVSTVLKMHLDVVEVKVMAILDKLPRAQHARHESIDRPACLPGTRTEVLVGIYQWIRADPQHQIYWLNGGAGTGKTTVALTLADTLAGDEETASAVASFFCSHTTSERSQMNLIFPSLAYLIAQHNKQFRHELVRVIQKDNDVGYGSLNRQYKNLLFRPLANITPPEQPIVLIIDALDECSEHRAPEKILTIIASGISSIPFLKVFVSSRPTSSTNDAFTDPGLKEKGHVFVLHNIPVEFVNEDIRKYLVDRLGRRRRSITLPPTETWPPAESVDILVHRSAGLFIYASTACAYIMGRGDPKLKLQFLVNQDSSALKGVDALYHHILKNAICRFEGDEQCLADCRTILAATFHLKDPWAVQDLAELLHISADHIRSVLGDLQAVMAVPDDSSLPLRTLHASFYDYMTSETRCLPEMFTPPPVAHNMLTFCLLEYMRSRLLRVNRPGHTARPTYILNPVESAALSYACLNWTSHFQNGSYQPSDAPSLEASLEAFAQEVFMDWLKFFTVHCRVNFESEIYHLMGSLSGYHCPDLLHVLRTLYGIPVHDVRGPFGSVLLPIFRPGTDKRLQQLYSTAPFSISYSPVIPDTTAFMLYPDGKHIVSGDHSGSIRVWEVLQSEVRLCSTWKAHDGPIFALACDRGDLVASASSSGDVKLWKRLSGMPLATEQTSLDTHWGDVSLAFSHNDQSLVLASPDGWCIWTCGCLGLILVGKGRFQAASVPTGIFEELAHTRWIRRAHPPLAFSPNDEAVMYIHYWSKRGQESPQYAESALLSLVDGSLTSSAFYHLNYILSVQRRQQPFPPEREEAQWPWNSMDANWQVGFFQERLPPGMTNRSLKINRRWICDINSTRLCYIPDEYHHLAVVALSGEFILIYLEDQHQFLVIRLQEDYVPDHHFASETGDFDSMV